MSEEKTVLRLAASNIGWSREDDSRVLKRMHELGYSGLEVAPTRLFPDTPYAHRSHAAMVSIALRKRYNFSVCSMQSIWFGKTGNIFNPEQVDDLLSGIHCAGKFGHAMSCDNLVFGCPRQRNVPEGHDPAEADEFFRQAGEAAASHGTVLALEANPPIYNTNFLNTTKEVFDYVKKLNVPGLAVNLDLGAILANGEKLADFAPDLGLVHHVHVSEPGLASIERREIHRELAEMLRAGGYKGFVSMEMRPADYDTVERCLTYLAEVFL